MRTFLKLLLTILFLTCPLAVRAQQANPANPQTPGFTLNSFDTQYLYYNDNAGNLKRTAVTPIQVLGTPQNPCLGTQTAVNVLNNFFYYCLNTSWTLISGGGGGGGSPGAPANSVQCNSGVSTFIACNASDNGSVFAITENFSTSGTASVSGATTLGGLLTVNATENLNGELQAKGPDPYTDVRAYGIRAVPATVAPAVPGVTCTIGSSSNSCALSSSSSFVNGDGVTIYGAGPANNVTTPTGLAVTPSVAAGPTGMDLDVAGPAGSTQYCYTIVARDKNGGLSVAPSQVCTSTGQASLGAQSVSISSWSRVGNTVTAVTSSAHGLSVGAYVYMYSSPNNNSDNLYFGGWYPVATVPDTTHFTYVTGNDVADGAPTASNGSGVANWWNDNHLTWTSQANAFVYYIYGRTSGGLTLLGASKVQSTVNGLTPDTTWDDLGSPLMDGITLPYFVPTAPPVSALADPLVTTISSGAGTFTLNLANAASTSVTNATIVFDNAPNIQTAAATVSFGGLLYFPASATGSYVVNSYLTLPTATTLSLAGANLWLNDTMQVVSADKIFGMLGPQTGSLLSFGWPVGGFITVNRADPGIYGGSAGIQRWDGIQINLQSNATIGVTIDDAGNSSYRFINFGCPGNMSIPFIDRANDFFTDFDHIAVICPQGTNGATATPAFVYSGGDVAFSNMSFSGRGMLKYDPIVGAGSDVVFTGNNRFQGGLTPFFTQYIGGGGIEGGTITFNNVELDTMNHAMFSAQGPATFGGFITFNNDVGGPSSGFGYVTGKPVGLVISPDLGQITGQNNAAIAAYNFTNNPVNVTGIGEFMVSIINNTAPTATGPTSGGSVPVATISYVMTVTDVNGNESTISPPSANITTTTGNQTITVAPPAAPTGAIGWKAYRCGANGANCSLANLPSGCGPAMSFSTNFVDTFGFGCGTSIPTLNRAGAQGIATVGINGSALNLTGGGFKDTLSGSFTANRAQTFPDISGTVGILSGSFTNSDCVQVQALAGTLSLVDSGAGCGGGGGGATFQVNGSNTSLQSTINFQNSAATDGLTLTFSNPSAGNVKLGFTGTLTNAGLANSSVTVNTSGPLGGGGAVSLGGSLTLTCATCSTAVINNGTANHLAEYTTTGSPATISSDGALDDGATATNTLTYTGSGGIAAPLFTTNGPGTGSLSAVEGSAPSGVALSDVFFAASAVHRWEMNNNNTGAVVVGANPMTTLGDTTYGGAAVSGVATETRLGIGSTNQVYLVSGGIPAWGLASLTASVTGLLPIANGGCNASTAATCIANIMPAPTRAGDVPFWNGSIWTTVAGNNSGTQVLSENASGVLSFTSNSVTLNTTAPLGGGGSVALGSALTFTCSTCDVNLTAANDVTTGTTVNLLAKLTSTGAILAGTGDTNVPVFVVISGAGTSGSAVLATGGTALCVMDATTSNTEGFYVIASTTTGGRCHAQAAQPSGTYVAGTLVSNSTTSGSTATYQVINTLTGAGGTVSSFTGDGTLITNSASTGAVTVTLGTAGAHKWWGNNTGSTAAPGYQTIGTGDLPGTGATTVNGNTCTLGSTCTVTLDQVGNPAASKTFTLLATNTLTLAGTAPSSGAGGGTNAGAQLTVSGTTGGATTGSATTAGTGSTVSITCGNGGSGAGGTNAIGGAGGSCGLTTGSGGLSGGTAANSSGGSFNLTLGSPGTGGSGTAGSNGAFNISQPITTAVTNSPMVNLIGEYQNAGTPTFAADTWTFQSVIGSGTNGTSTLNLTHSGTSGTATFALPNLTTATTQSAGDITTDVATDAFVTTAVANAIAAVNPAVAVLAATTGSNLTGTYTQVGGGIGDTFTITATGAFTLDGVAINTIGQRILIKDQSTSSQNGVYTATVVGTTGVSAVFTRALDYDTASDINNSGIIPVQSGTANTDTSWLLTSQVTSVGSSGSAITYTQFSLSTSIIVTAASNFTSGDLVQAAGSNKTTSDSGIATANVPTAASNAAAAKQVAVSGGANKTLSFIDFPQMVYAPAADCVNAVAGSGWSTGSTPAALCRAGTNNKDALLSPWGASDVGYFKIHLPNDWDSGASLDISLDLTSTDATNGHTIIMQASTACAKGDGSTTDDVAFNSAQSFGTITLNGNANRTWNATLTGLTKTGCIAGSTLWVKVSRTTDTATNVGVYGATVDVARLLTVQAN